MPKSFEKWPHGADKILAAAMDHKAHGMLLTETWEYIGLVEIT